MSLNCSIFRIFTDKRYSDITDNIKSVFSGNRYSCDTNYKRIEIKTREHIISYSFYYEASCGQDRDLLLDITKHTESGRDLKISREEVIKYSEEFYEKLNKCSFRSEPLNISAMLASKFPPPSYLPKNNLLTSHDIKKLSSEIVYKLNAPKKIEILYFGWKYSPLSRPVL